MGTRNFTFDALVLRRWPIGETHRGVGFLTRERGPLSAIAHGAAASQGRLKLLTTPLRHVTLKAYHDPVADSWKVVDLEPLQWWGGLAEDLDRSATASIWAELLWRTQVTGNACDVYDLFVEGLTCLEGLRGAAVGALHVQVLWRALVETGVAPDFSTCAECGRALGGQDVFVLPPHGEPVCQRCAAGRGRRLAGSAVDALLAAEVLSLDEACRVPLAVSDREALAGEVVAAWERTLGAALKSVRVFAGSGGSREGV